MVSWNSAIWSMIDRIPVIDSTAGVGVVLDRFDLGADVFGGLGGLLGEFFDLVGDDGEALAGFAGTCGFDGGVEGEEVGLLGDAGDDLDDLADLGARCRRVAATVSLVTLAASTAWPATLAASLALRAISLIDDDICSLAAETVSTLRETSTEASETKLTWREVSAELPPIWAACLLNLNCGQENADLQRLGDVPAGQGVGLGLAVSRGFAQANGGTLEAEETPGGGLTMVLTLQRAEATDPDDGLGDRP